MGQTRCRARPARSPAAQEPGARQSAPLPRRPSGAAPVARPSPGAEGAGWGPRVARSHEQQGAPTPTGPARGETVTRATWGPGQLTDSHLGFLRAAVAPLRPPPLLFLSRRRRRAAPSTNSGLVVGNWKCGSHSPPPPSPSAPAPAPALHSARLRSLPPKPPPPRARLGSPRPPSSSSPSRRRRRGALPPGLARAPDAGERALGLEEAPPPPGSRAPPLWPRLRDQVEPPPSARRLRPGPMRRPRSAASPWCPRSWPRALRDGHQTQSAPALPGRNCRCHSAFTDEQDTPPGVKEAPPPLSKSLHSKNPPAVGHKG
ncbi:unnamed protein product [Rangifer tarandus platyrhynchus]|uniref:Basic proline-rich protein-like n=1 Tax=Rangifer tarandus platyrhynchus TaxID=3082113 RepID=A0ABN8YG27_RANTA|nr:unnamed protein product [Rangifer tarandus platyrhynchus]